MLRLKIETIGIFWEINSSVWYGIWRCINWISASTEPRSPRSPEVKYRVGQVIRHKIWGYRGVIVAWDPQARVSEKLSQQNLAIPTIVGAVSLQVSVMKTSVFWYTCMYYNYQIRKYIKFLETLITILWKMAMHW